MIYQVDAFAKRLFAGNPAAVVLVDEWPEDFLLQSIAAENNLSETAFIHASDEAFDIRWFTPAAEVDLCGHATLAAGHILLKHALPDADRVTFRSRSGELSVRRADEGRLELDFPAWPGEQLEVTPGVAQTLGAVPEEFHQATYFMAVFGSESEIRALRPDLQRVSQLGETGLIVTAPGDDCDFVSRFFAPRVGIPEDPVTGSAHCALTPYWSARLGKASLHARQVSERGGELWCTLDGKRVRIAGHAVEFLTGVIRIP